MRTLVAATLLLFALSLGTPVQAGHTHSLSAPYFSGGGFQIDDVGRGIVTCGGVLTLLDDLTGSEQGCIGGADMTSEHWAEDVSVSDQNFGLGYTSAYATATDTAFGNQVSIWLCLPGQADYNTGGDPTDPFSVTCNNVNDVIVWSCGLGATSASTATNGGFRALAAVTFIDVFAVDSTTSSVCFSTQGILSVTFSG